MLPFINMAMLAGLTAAAVPVIIHLLNKSRYRVVRWGAMIFLGSSTSKKRRSINLQQILLLIIRTLLIACFALALARPWLPGRQRSPRVSWVGRVAAVESLV